MTGVPLRVLGRTRGGLVQTGDLFAMALEAIRRTWDVRNWFWEFIEQAWFLARVTTVPSLLVALPLGATTALQVGWTLTRSLVCRARTVDGQAAQQHPQDRVARCGANRWSYPAC